MAKTLVLAEKPSVGKDIARVLGCSKKSNGYFEGTKYIVTWALGHLVTLATPETYDKKLATWRLEDLPMLPGKLKTTVIPKTTKQFHTVKSQLTRQDVGDIIIATDAGREGELVARWIIDKARVNKPMKRLWISSVTDKAIRDGFQKLQHGKKYFYLYEAAMARAEADWYVGLNATRALTTKHNAQLSAGRVQTPTLGIIATRESEINHFRSEKYYHIQLQTKSGLTLNWQNKQGNDRIFSKEKAEKLRELLTNEKTKIISITKKEKKQFAPQLYDLTELQRDANRIFGFSGKQTLQATQQLYERYKVLTYPRTDSRVITSDIVPTLNERLDACHTEKFRPIAHKLKRKQFKLPKSVVNDQAVSDHHAIIPTEEPVDTSALGSNERKIYDLVVSRFLEVLSDPYIYEEIKIEATHGHENFTTKTINVISPGWKEINGNIATNQQNIPHKGQIIDTDIQLTSGETAPPDRLTEGALLKAMENPTAYMSQHEKHHQKTLQKVGGIGTVATRADIIDKLINGQYIEARGKFLHLTPTGKQLLELAPTDLRSPALTAEWEEKLLQIEQGKLDKNQFIKEIKQYTQQITNEIKHADTTFKHDNITGTKCPQCDGFMLEIENRHGKMLRCKDQSCNYKKNVYKNTNARCPNCKKRLKLYGEGDGQMFTCSCGHREKLSTFEKRKKTQNHSRASKKSVHQFMKKQEEFTNNPFADALKNLKK